jgi:hypothetical protein
MPGRSYSRSKKGGAVNQDLTDLKTSLTTIQDDVKNAMDKLNSLEKNIQSKEPEEKEEEEKEEEEKEEEEKEEEAKIPGPLDDTDTDEEPEEVKEEIKLDDQPISINGFDGTVKQLKDSMKRKAGQLSKNKKYKDKADSITATIKEINDKAANSKDVEEIVTSNISLTFKNNNLMGGKKTVSHKKRKVRRSRKKH